MLDCVRRQPLRCKYANSVAGDSIRLLLATLNFTFTACLLLHTMSSSSKALLYTALASSARVKTLEAEILERQQLLVVEKEALAIADQALVQKLKDLNKAIATATTKLAEIKKTNSIYEGQISLRKAEIDRIWKDAGVSLGATAAGMWSNCST